MSQADVQYRTPLLVAAVLITVWAILGALDARNVPYTGYTTDSGYVVISVTAGSPAQAADLRLGDRVLTIDGINVENTSEMLQRPRAEIGATTTIEVERDASPTSIDVINGEQPASSMMLSYAGALIGLCFLFFGFSAYTKAPARKTLLLALIGVGFGFNFSAGPYIASPMLSSLIGAIGVAIIYLCLAMLYHFILSMPQASAAMEQPATLRLLYAPAIVAGLALALIIVLQVDATSGLNRMLQILIGLVVAGYFIGCIVAMIKRYISAGDAERLANGLGLMLAGTTIGFAPVIISIVSGIIAPSVVLPGSNYYILTFVLIPITFSMAAVRSVRNEPAAAT